MKVLVTAASRHGSTDEMADAIGATLDGAGIEVVRVAPDEVQNLVDYDAVVLGSAIYMGRWMDASRAFVERFRGELAQLPLWMFSSGPIGDPPKPEGTPPDVLALIDRVRPREHRVFAGVIDRHELGLAEKVVTRVVRAPDGDFRQWADIGAWASGIAETLTSELGWRHEGAAEREVALTGFWQRELESPTPVG
jgi:menaquinone-dependent protoporphyrinogen oxidase